MRVLLDTNLGLLLIMARAPFASTPTEFLNHVKAH
jgi:hypothetical protein